PAFEILSSCRINRRARGAQRIEFPAACYVEFNSLPKSVIPACFYPSISLGTVRFSNRRESSEVLTGPPTHSKWLRVVVSISRTTIKTFGGDNSEKIVGHVTRL